MGRHALRQERHGGQNRGCKPHLEGTSEPPLGPCGGKECEPLTGRRGIDSASASPSVFLFLAAVDEGLPLDGKPPPPTSVGRPARQLSPSPAGNSSCRRSDPSGMKGFCGRKKASRASAAAPEPPAHSPASARMRLDLPQPLGPTTSSDWPGLRGGKV